MVEKIHLKAESRTLLGKGVKKMRREGRVPGVVFEKNIESLPISLDIKDFLAVFGQAGESSLVELSIDGSADVHIIINDVEVHPVTNALTHINLRKVSLREKIKAHVPVVAIGENALVKAGEGNLLIILSEIEVECLPQDIPHEFEIDITPLLVVDDTIFVKDLKFDAEKVEMLTDLDEPILKIAPITVVEEEPEEVVDEATLVEGVEATAESAEEAEPEAEG
ncbi:hypothetical protein A3A70_00615 [candidate division WWE3 bacterium RIFCSPLOWO2_01_FULL_42_11]|uniref:Large ribosomal subunit protein bL25 n=1 Tax=candidate division WWE3 bacterium RIFCSPLOWO2_01_FULL_42_11 TaxID=1802627 RepID=A0A1F4VNI9_UNCKA|nr:MAG: hypothetical protein A3A70_00615 [candidate division WWE3 bacterium RIFCSPLOWO2_01_FULL_42_11]